MTVEQVLRKIEKESRDNIAAFTGYAPKWRENGTGPVMDGAKSEARGVVSAYEEVRILCRKLRAQHTAEMKARQ